MVTIQKRIEDLDKEFDKKFNSLEVMRDKENKYFAIIFPKDRLEHDEYGLEDVKSFYHQQILELIKDYGESLIPKKRYPKFEPKETYIAVVWNECIDQMRATLEKIIKKV